MPSATLRIAMAVVATRKKVVYEWQRDWWYSRCRDHFLILSRFLTHGSASNSSHYFHLRLYGSCLGEKLMLLEVSAGSLGVRLKVHPLFNPRVSHLAQGSNSFVAVGKYHMLTRYLGDGGDGAAKLGD
jgi:hypothetical protein